jgi:hypothetical protein
LTTRSSAWGLSALFQNDVLLSAKEINNLVSSPVILLGTPGRGQATFIQSIVARSVFGSTAFVNPGAGSAIIAYDGPNSIPATSNLIDLSPLITGPQSATQNVIAIGSGAIGNLTDTERISEISDHNITISNPLSLPQNFSGGDGGLKIAILYVIITL